MKKTNQQVAEDLIEICKACVAFDNKKVDVKKAIIYRKFHSHSPPEWVIDKTVIKDSHYHKDILALLSVGADDRNKKALATMLGIPEDNFWIKSYGYLNTLVVPWLNNSITSQFKSASSFLEAHKIDPYGNGHNWAKFVVALANHPGNGIKDVIKFFHLEIYNKETEKENMESEKEPQP